MQAGGHEFESHHLHCIKGNRDTKQAIMKMIPEGVIGRETAGCVDHSKYIDNCIENKLD